MRQLLGLIHTRVSSERNGVFVRCGIVFFFWIYLTGISIHAQQPETRSLQVITRANAMHLTYLGLVGRGTPDEYIWSSDMRSLAVVNRLRGAWVYQTADLPSHGADWVDTTTPLFLPVEFGNALSQVRFSPDGRTLLFVTSVQWRGDGESILILWDVETGQQRWRVAAVGQQTPVIAWSQDGWTLAYSTSMTNQASLHVLDSGTGRSDTTFAGPPEPNIRQMAFDSDGTRLLVTADSRVQLVDLASPHLRQEWRLETERFVAAALSANGQQLALQTQTYFSLYDLTTDHHTLISRTEILYPYYGPFQSQLAFSPDGRWMAVYGLQAGVIGSSFAGVGIWDIEAQDWHRVFLGRAPFVFHDTGLAFLTQDEKQALFWEDTTGNIVPLACDLKVNEVLQRFIRQHCPPPNLAHYYDAAATQVTFDQAASSYQLVLSQPRGRLYFDLTEPMKTFFDSDDGVSLGMPGRIISAPPYLIHQFSSIGCYCPNGGWTIRKTSNGVQAYVGDINPMGGYDPETAIGALALSPSAQWAASGHSGGVIRIWAVDTLFDQVYTRINQGLEMNIISAHTTLPDSGIDAAQIVTGLVFQNDETLVSVGRYDSTIRFWNVTSGESLGFLETPFARGFEALAFSPDKRWLATSEGVWDMTTQTFAYSLNHSESLLFNTDSRLLFASQDNLLMILDSTTGELLFRTPDEYVSGVPDSLSMALSPDGKVLVTVTNGVIRAWGVPENTD